MNAQEFAYWLQGFFELNEAGTNEHKELSPAQVKMIREHLQLVFKKATGPQTFIEPPDFVPAVLPEPAVFPYIPEPSRTIPDPWNEWRWTTQTIYCGTTATSDMFEVVHPIQVQ